MSTCGFRTPTGYMQLHSQLGKISYLSICFPQIEDQKKNKTCPIRNDRDTTDRYTPVSSFHAT